MDINSLINSDIFIRLIHLGVHANQISIWKKQFHDAVPAAFSSGKDKDAEKKEAERDHFYQKVG